MMVTQIPTVVRARMQVQNKKAMKFKRNEKLYGGVNQSIEEKKSDQTSYDDEDFYNSEIFDYQR